MVDAIVSFAAERIAALLEEQIGNEVNLVRGVEKEVRSLSTELNTIRNVLDDAERRRFKEKHINTWLQRLEHIASEIEDVLDEWSFNILKLKQKKVRSTFFIPSSIKKAVVRHDIATKIKNVKQQLDDLLKEKDRYKFVESHPADPSPESWRVQSTSSIDLDEVPLGRDSDRDVLVNKLIMSNTGGGQLGGSGSLRILSIVGGGGLGKTTLAQLVYNHDQVKESFELRIWICVSDPFNEFEIAKGIIRSMKKENPPDTNQLNDLCEDIKEFIREKKFFLVLDDVWSKNSSKWKPLKQSLQYGGKGSVILVTTRNQEVAEMMGTTGIHIHHLEQLSDDDCWKVLRRLALSGRESEELESIGKDIAKKCKGLPLAAKTLGSLLRSKNSLEEWKNVLNSEIWKLEKAEVELFPHLLLSYNELSPELKRCFSYCAVFPKDSVIEVESLIGMWIAQGFLGFNIGNATGDMELKGREYFRILAMSSLFQNFEKNESGEQIESFKMHDITHDFAIFLRKNSILEARRKEKTTCQDCSNSSSVKIYRSLFLEQDKPPGNLCGSLKSLRALRLSRCQLQGIPQGMKKLIHLKWLNLSRNDLSGKDMETIYKLYNLQVLLLSSCDLLKISMEIGNLSGLRHLDLSGNCMVELPESICGLHELRILNLDGCRSLVQLPQGINTLINLKHLPNESTYSLQKYPEGLAQLTGLRTLTEFYGGSGGSKLGWLKNLNSLSGDLMLDIRLSTDDDDLKDVVADARKAELRKKIRIQNLVIGFRDGMVEKESPVRMYVIDALEPQPNLQRLVISMYYGYKLPGWITSLNQLSYICLWGTNQLSSLSPLGKLPCLEEIVTQGMNGLHLLRKDFSFGTTTTTTTTGDAKIESSSSSMLSAAANTIIAFPKLKKLKFDDCTNWKEWEDITAEEENSATVSLMPCLTELTVQYCKCLMALPHRLLHKMSSLEKLNIIGSVKLEDCYGDKDGSAWKSISQNNPRLQLVFWRMLDLNDGMQS